MKREKYIQVKALFLLIVFSLNTLLGFACSIGIDMGYNSKHHHNENSVSEDQPYKTSGNCHADYSDEENVLTPTNDEESDSSKDHDCCSNGVLKFLTLDKKITPSTAVDLNTSVLLMAVQFAYQIDLLHYLKNNTARVHYFVRSDHPPIPDIRIAIQSFLI